ncbi:MAG: gamma-glutamyl-gamma-aminobutyrate hydrolase family protein, partial [Candidatus Spechtbacterales bacterium]
EFARTVCGLRGAHTTEINPATKDPVIDVMEEQKEKLRKNQYGASMRLGAYECELVPGSRASGAYRRAKSVSERHRHRYEVNNAYLEVLTKKGLVVSGTNPQTGLVEIMELPKHPFFIGTQFHPELQSRPMAPHPLFLEFIKVASKRKR